MTLPFHHLDILFPQKEVLLITDHAYQSPGISHFPGPVPLIHPPISNGSGYRLPPPVYGKNQAMNFPTKTPYQTPLYNAQSIY